jgi:hypothetical protein
MRLRRRRHGTRITLDTGGLRFVEESRDDVKRRISLNGDAPPAIFNPVSAYDANGERIEPEPIALRIEHVSELRDWDRTPTRRPMKRTPAVLRRERLTLAVARP